MRSSILLAGLLALTTVGCEDPNKKKIEKIDQDTQILQGVNRAVNEVLRNQTDCAVAKPLITEAYQKIDDARGKVQGPASPTTLDALKTQVDRVAQICP
jgi:hypothetical protein